MSVILKVSEDDGSTCYYKLNKEYESILTKINNHQFTLLPDGATKSNGETKIHLDTEHPEFQFINMFRWGYRSREQKYANVAHQIRATNKNKLPFDYPFDYCIYVC